MVKVKHFKSKISGKAFIINKIGGWVLHLFFKADINFSEILRLVLLTFSNTQNLTKQNTQNHLRPLKHQNFRFKPLFHSSLNNCPPSTKKSLTSPKNRQIRIFSTIIYPHKNHQPILTRISRKIFHHPKIQKITSQNFSRPYFSDWIS